MIPSVKEIEQYIEKNRVKNTYLDPQLSVQCVVDLKHHILQEQDRARAIVVLQVVLHLSKPNDSFFEHCDEHFLNAIFAVVTKSAQAELVIAVLRIMLIYLSGSLFDKTPRETYLVPFLNSSNLNLKIMEVLTSKLYLENNELTIKIADFIAAYLTIDHIGLKSINHLIEFILTLGKTDFNFLMTNYYEDLRTDASARNAIVKLMTTSLQAYQTLSGVKLLEDSSFQTELVQDVCAELSKASKKEERQYIIDHFSALQLMDFFLFFESSNISFKKTFHQQLLFTLQKEQIFPLTEISGKITQRLLVMYTEESALYPNLSKYIFSRDLLHYNLVSKFLDIWIESKAEYEDLDVLFPLVTIILQQLDISIGPEGDFDVVHKIQSGFKTLDYTALRQIQLNNFKNHVDCSTRTDTAAFDKILREQVFEFVKNQRFLQLAKGSWVYADLPSFKNSSQTSSSYYFIILSPNFAQLLYKEFKHQSNDAPNIDKSGHAIAITSISSFKIEEIPYADSDSQAVQTSTRLVNLVDKTIIHRITLLNRKSKPLFSFYAKKSDSLKWVDGLNLLLGNRDKLSSELHFQTGKLFDIRKTAQLLNFDEQTSRQIEVSEVGDSLEQLEKLATNFYYT
jgi:hypothetical protein